MLRLAHRDTTGSFKLNLATICEDGVVMTQERQAFLDLHELYGLPESALDAEITLSGLRLRIAGIRTKAPKNNILLASLDGSGNRVAPLSVVKAALKRSQG